MSLIIVNPVAGRGRALAVWRWVQPFLIRQFPDPEIHFTTGPGDAERRADTWSRTHPDAAIVLVGGDGSMHEAINGALPAGLRGPFALVPAGTGNDMARNLGLPLDPLAAVERLDPARPRLVDLGRCRVPAPDGTERTRWFLNSVSLGVSARANRIALGLASGLLGASRYPVAGALALLTGGPAEYDVEAGGRTLFSGHALNLTIANGAGFGGGLRISPRSKPDDGALDLVTIGPLGRARAIAALARLRSGRHLDLPGVACTTGLREAIRIRSRRAPAEAEADGENFLAPHLLVIEPVPGRLRIL